MTELWSRDGSKETEDSTVLILGGLVTMLRGGRGVCASLGLLLLGTAVASLVRKRHLCWCHVHYRSFGDLRPVGAGWSVTAKPNDLDLATVL